MAGRWWRAYDDAMDHEKLMALPVRLRWRWFEFMCLASRAGGQLPAKAVLSTSCRSRQDVIEADLKQIISAGLIDEVDGRLIPHNWSTRQYKSDVSTERTRKHKERRKAVPGNGAGTSSETPPETDTETEKKKNIIIASSGARSTADDAEGENRFDKIERAIHAALPAEVTWKVKGDQNLKPILDAMDDGADLDLDVVPAIREVAARARADGSAVYRWNYFAETIRARSKSRQQATTHRPAQQAPLDDATKARLWAATSGCGWRPSEWGPEPGKSGCTVPDEVWIAARVDPRTGRDLTGRQLIEMGIMTEEEFLATRRRG